MSLDGPFWLLDCGCSSRPFVVETCRSGFVRGSTDGSGNADRSAGLDETLTTTGLILHGDWILLSSFIFLLDEGSDGANDGDDDDDACCLFDDTCRIGFDNGEIADKEEGIGTIPLLLLCK